MSSGNPSKRNAAGGMPEGMKRTLMISSAGAALIACGVWAYMTFTAVPPPALTAEAKIEDVTGFLVHPRGFARLPVEQRETFMADTVRRFSSPEERRDFSRSLARLSSKDRQVLEDAIFDVARVRFMEKAREFNQTPPSKHRQFVDRAIREFDGMRAQFAGGPGAQNLGEPFKADMPTSNDEWTKFVVTKTSPRERADAQAFFDALTARQKELKNPRERERFNAGG